MNVLASLLLLGVSALPIDTTFAEEIVPVTSEDIEGKRSPVMFAVHRVGQTGLSIDFALANPADVTADIAPYQLFVFSQPVTFEGLPGQSPGQPNQLVRTEMVRGERATFNLRREELPNCTLMIYLTSQSKTGARSVQGFCLPLAELMKTVKLDRRRPLPDPGGPQAA